MKRMLAILLTVCMLLSIVPTVLASDSGYEPVTEGSQVEWKFDETEGKLYIRGAGEIPEFANTSVVPWAEYRTKIKTVEIADTVTTIGKYAFNNHNALTSICIPDSVVSIGRQAFYGCTALETVAIGNGVKEIGQQAFASCSELFAVTIGSGLEELVTKTFQYCNKITEIYYIGTQSQWEELAENIESNNGAIYGFDADDVICMPTAETGKSGEVSWTFDPMTFTLTISGEGAMEDYKDTEQDWYDYRKVIRTVVVESGVTAIGAGAFRYCQMVGEVYIPATVTSIGDNAFANGRDLKDVYYGSSEGAWAAVNKGSGNALLTGANIHYIGDCAHTNVTEKVIANNDGTHYIRVICICGTVMNETEPEACGDEDADGKCDFCGGAVEITCNGENHPNAKVVYSPNDKEADVFYTHTVVDYCPECEKEVGKPYVEACSDNDGDGKCDYCKLGTPCIHTDYEASASTNYNGNNTHTVITICGNCHMDIGYATADCTDENQDLVCDVCEGEMDGVYYTLSDSGVLTIYGKGRMEDYASFTGMPWSAERDNVKEIVIEEGITHIGARSFYRCILATKVTIAASVKSIGDSAFYRCDSLKNVTFGGDKAQWDELVAASGTNNEKLTGAAVEWVCSHPETTVKTVSNADGKTHTVTTSCTDCSYVHAEVVDCTAGESVYTKGEDNKHTVTVKCAVCEQLLSETAEDCFFATAYANNGDRTHAVTKTCTKCAAATTANEKCVDGEDEDSLCDLCKADLECAHSGNFTKGYLGNDDHYTHVPYMFCATCGEPVYKIGDVVSCTDADENDICDLCGQDISCLHEDAVKHIRYESNADRTHKVVEYEVCGMEGCDGLGLSVEILDADEACVDENGDRLCDKCGYNLTCAHVEVERKVEYLGTYKHRVSFICKNCKGVISFTDEKCVDLAPADKKCDVCEGVCTHHYDYAYAKIENRERHNVTGTCAWCGNVIDFNEACADVTGEGTVHDGKCDKCFDAVACTHTGHIAYDAKDGEVHDATGTCTVCGDTSACENCLTYIFATTEQPCVDANHDQACESCKDTVACKHDSEENGAEANNDGTHKVICGYCGVVLEEAAGCDDTDGDLYCDTCGYDMADIRIVGKNAYETLDKAVAAAVEGDEIVVRVKAVVEGNNIWNLDGITLTTAAVEDNYSIVLKGNLTINGGTFNIGGTYGIGVTGSLTVNGGEFNAEEKNDYLIGNWGTLTINGGQFNGVYCAVNNFAGTTTITDGTFSTEETDWSGEYEACDILGDSGIAISGGLFSKPVYEGDCAEGYVPVDNGDGTYGVEKAAEKFAVAGTTINLGNELMINFYLPKEKMDAAEKELTVYVTHKASGEDIEYTFDKEDWASNKSNYVISVPVKSTQMADDIEIAVKDADGYQYNNAYVDSIRAYVGRMAKPTSSTYNRTLMVDMVNYGAASQNYFTYKTADLANAQLTDEQKSWATASVECNNDDQVKGTNYAGSTLNLKDRILLNVYFKNTGVTAAILENMYATVSFTGYKGNVVNEEVEVKMNTNGLYVEVDQIVLGDSFESVTVTVYNADGTVYGQGSDSVEAYASRNSTKELFVNIAKFAFAAREYMLNK